MLTLVPTPIGNLDDISKRSIDALAGADKILCEDTRVTKKLLQLLSQKYDITFNCSDFRSFHHHNEDQILNSIDINEFKTQNIIYVSDAGMPCISDPGSSLVRFCQENAIEVDVLPGANAVLAAFALSGFENTEFTFFGFLPHKGSQRHQKLLKVLQNEHISILYESPHRLLKFLEEISSLDASREIFMVKELTKLYQKSYKASANALLKKFQNENIKGEWVVVIKGKKQAGENLELSDIIDLKLPPKQKTKLISKLTGRNAKEIYNEFLESGK